MKFSEAVSILLPLYPQEKLMDDSASRKTETGAESVAAPRALHTPWKAVQPPSDPQAWDVVTANGGVIAKLTWGPNSAYNARLMASAPELLDVLQAISEEHVDMDANGWIELSMPNHLYMRLHAAIKKARGE